MSHSFFSEFHVSNLVIFHFGVGSAAVSVLTECIVTSSILRPRTCLILYLYGLFVKVETEKCKGLGLNLIRNNYKIELGIIGNHAG